MPDETMPAITERFTATINNTKVPLELGVDIEEFKRRVVSIARDGGGFLTIPGGDHNTSVFVSTGLGLMIERSVRDQSAG